MKRIILVAVFLLIAGGGLLTLQNHRSYRNLKVSFGENISNVSAVILQNDKEIKKISAPETIRIKAGEYNIQTTGSDEYEQINTTHEVVDDNQELLINPSYSETKLSRLLESQEGQIHNAIRSHVDVGQTFRINPGKLYAHGEWYGTTIIPNLSEEELRTSYVDVFRVVLQKSDDEWKILTPVPKLVLTRVELPTVPPEVLSKTNRQYGEAETNF